MSAFLLGNLLGRLLFSIFLVWLVLLLIHRFKGKAALQIFRKPVPIIAVLLVYFLGLVGTVKAESQDEQQLVHVMIISNVKLASLFLPAEARWEYPLD